MTNATFDNTTLFVVNRALLTPGNPARSMDYRAYRHRIRAPINNHAEVEDDPSGESSDEELKGFCRQVLDLTRGM